MENLIRPAFLTLVGAGLSLQPLFSESRWEWNGIETSLLGYLFLGGGLLWLAGATVGVLKGSQQSTSSTS